MGGRAGWLAGGVVLLYLIHVAYLAGVAEDAFISFRYARNLVAGAGLVWNPGEAPVEGYTNFLWVLLLAGFLVGGLEPGAASQAAGVAAGLATLELAGADGFHQQLDRAAKRLTSGLQAHADKAGIPFTTKQVGGMFGYFFSPESAITRFEQVTACDMDRFQAFYHGMLDAGVYLAPSAYETGFISSAHSDAVIDATLDAAEQAFAAL